LELDRHALALFHFRDEFVLQLLLLESLAAFGGDVRTHRHECVRRPAPSKSGLMDTPSQKVLPSGRVTKSS